MECCRGRLEWSWPREPVSYRNRCVVAVVSGDVAEEVQGYRPTCGLAFAGLLLGMLSAVAFFGPILWAVPALAVVVNLAALRQIAAETRLRGRQAARVGLMLALFLGAGAVAFQVSVGSLQAAKANFVIEQFFHELTQGDVYLAHQLMKDLEERKGSGDLSTIYERDTKLLQEINGLRTDPLMGMLVDRDKHARVHWHSTFGRSDSGHTQVITEIYKLTYDEAGKRRSRLIKVSAIRHIRDAHLPHAWKISGVEEFERP